MCGCAAGQKAVPYAPHEIPKDTRITLERTPCFGECDWYKLSISADGSVEFAPQRYGADSKPVALPPLKDKIGVDGVRKLIAEFERIDYFSLDDKYDISNRKSCPNAATDHSSAITSITIGGKSKQIHHYHGCEGNPILEKLTALEDKIDQIALRQEWLLELRNQ
jgi:hypothetical protein